MEFDLIGVDAAIANAFRRIMLAEVCYLFSITLCLLRVFYLYYVDVSKYIYKCVMCIYGRVLLGSYNGH